VSERVAGDGIAYLAGRIVTNWLYEMRVSDPIILGAAAGLVSAVALIATVIPAYCAARLDPARVLWSD
jgi:ABC-type lipoprotein release transport system permease subunit